MFGMVRFGEFLEAYDELAYTLRILGYNVNLYILFYSFYVRNNPQQHTPHQQQQLQQQHTHRDTHKTHTKRQAKIVKYK